MRTQFRWYAAAAVVLTLASFPALASAAVPRTESQRSSAGANLPNPTGARPGVDWLELVPLSVFSPEDRRFSWLVGTRTAGGCGYSGTLELNEGEPKRQMIGVWGNPTTCTMQVMTGRVTQEFASRADSLTTSGSQQIKPATSPKSIRRSSAEGSAANRAASPHGSSARSGVTSPKRVAWDHVVSQDFFAVDPDRYQFGIRPARISWNGVWSDPCEGYAQTWWNGVEWGQAYNTDGGNCWVGYPSWSAGNRWVIMNSAAWWNSNVYNATYRCGSTGATGHWWTKLYGRGGHPSVIEWYLETGGPCGGWLSPYLG